MSEEKTSVVLGSKEIVEDVAYWQNLKNELNEIAIQDAAIGWKGCKAVEQHLQLNEKSKKRLAELFERLKIVESSDLSKLPNMGECLQKHDVYSLMTEVSYDEKIGKEQRRRIFENLYQIVIPEDSKSNFMLWLPLLHFVKNYVRFAAEESFAVKKRPEAIVKPAIPRDPGYIEF